MRGGTGFPVPFFYAVFSLSVSCYLSAELKDYIILFVYLACGEVTKSISSYAVRYHIEDISPVPQGTDIIN